MLKREQSQRVSTWNQKQSSSSGIYLFIGNQRKLIINDIFSVRRETKVPDNMIRRTVLQMLHLAWDSIL